MRGASLNKIVSLALFFGGLAVLLLGRILPGQDRSLLTGIGMIAIGLSFFTDAVLPGGSELTDQQAVMLRHNRVPTGKRAVKGFSLAVGAALTLGGAYLAAVNL